jgi:hypothetical protein
MVSRRTTSKAKAKAAAMLKSFEADYTTACKTKNPQMLKKYFEDLSDDHLKQLCKSANIDARKRETRIEALAEALLERKSVVQKAFQVVMLIIRGHGFLMLPAMAMAFSGGLIEVGAFAYFLDRTNSPEASKALKSRIYLFVLLCVWAGDTMRAFVKNSKRFGTTKASRRLLRQMRALHTVRAPSKTSKTKKSS